MTADDRQILSDTCQLVKQLVECILAQDQAWRSLSQALQKHHFHDLDAEYREAQKDLIYESGSTPAIHKLQTQIDGIIQRLNQPS